MSPLLQGSEVRVEHITDWIMVHESQRIPILGGIPAGTYIVLEDLGKLITLLPKEGGHYPVTTYRL